MKKNPRQPDPLRAMPQEKRVEAMRALIFNLVGDENGAVIWQQMEPLMTTTMRQLGDARDPQKNYWKGVWKIHELT